MVMLSWCEAEVGGGRGEGRGVRRGGGSSGERWGGGVGRQRNLVRNSERVALRSVLFVPKTLMHSCVYEYSPAGIVDGFLYVSGCDVWGQLHSYHTALPSQTAINN